MADAELAWTSFNRAARVIDVARSKVLGDGKCHPTQKAEAVMSFCLSWAGGETVIDPFMGSGTTLRAAKDLGREAIGIEIEEKYCEIAVERLRQGVMNF